MDLGEIWNLFGRAKSDLEIIHTATSRYNAKAAALRAAGYNTPDIELMSNGEKVVGTRFLNEARAVGNLNFRASRPGKECA